ncbi:MAG: hypothetical protein JRJ57_10800 [Deltaproteobacteria bacterium]|nr:hypothetical protein [Deltaproteobacteria bacterium]
MALRSKILIGLAFVCALLVLIMLHQRQTIRELKRKPPVTLIDTVVMHYTHYDTVYPTPITLVRTEYDTIYRSDTVWTDDPVTREIAENYYATRYYDDVLKDDSTGYVRIQSTVRENTLTDRRMFYEARCQDKYITETIQDNSMRLYFTPSLMVSRYQVGIQGSLILITEKDRMFTLGGGYFTEPFVSAGIGFKF